MSTFPGDLYTSLSRYASQAKMNIKSNLVGTGDQILAKNTGTLVTGMIASVTANSTNGVLKTGIYRWDGSAWTSPTGGIHTHTSVADGGTFQNILLQAIRNTWFVNEPSVTKEQFFTSGTGGTYSNVISGTNCYVEVSSGATSTNSGNLRYGGINYSFGSPLAFITRIQLASTTTNSAARCGLNMETADAVTDNKVKFGFEGCSTCNSTSMSIISADGTTRSKNTTSADSYAGVGNFIMQLDPGVNVKYRKEVGTIITKTTNVPSSGTPDRANAWVAGIQTTTAAARTLQLYGFQAVGAIGDIWPTL